MKTWITAAALCLTVVATGCGTMPAKQPNEPTVATSAPRQPTATPAQPVKAESKDPWTYYNNAKWTDTYNGLTFEIEKVAVSDTAPKLPSDESPGDTSSIVGVKFKMTNTTANKFTFYPDQAKLVTSTGEQIDMPDLFSTTHIGGEIDEGVTKEGDIVWLLQRGHAEDITWIKVSFQGHTGDSGEFGNPPKRYEVKLVLK